MCRNATAKCRQDSIPIRLSFPAIYFVLPIDSSRCNNRVFIFQFPINSMAKSTDRRCQNFQFPFNDDSSQTEKMEVCCKGSKRRSVLPLGRVTVGAGQAAALISPSTNDGPQDQRRNLRCCCRCSPLLCGVCVRADLCIILCRFGCDGFRSQAG